MPSLEAAFEQADTVVPLTGDDEVTTIDLPFPFRFYGETLTRTHLCTNGFVEFVGPTTTNCSASNAAIPTTGRPNGAVYGTGTTSSRRPGLDPGRRARERARPALRDRVPQRPLLPGHCGGSTSTSSCTRTARSTQYRNIADDGRERGNSATLGIEYHTGAAALRFSFNQTLLAPEPAVTSIRYLPAPTHAVSGQVRDADDQPVANATVTIEGTPLTATTATDGAYCSRACPRAPTPSRRRDSAHRRLAGAGRVRADDARLHAAAAQRRVRSYM